MPCYEFENIITNYLINDLRISERLINMVHVNVPYQEGSYIEHFLSNKKKKHEKILSFMTVYSMVHVHHSNGMMV